MEMISIRQLSRMTGENPQYLRGVIDESGIVPAVTTVGHFLSPEDADLIRDKIREYRKRRAAQVA